MTKTDLATVAMPSACKAWVEAADPSAEILDHEISVDLDWWNTRLRDRRLDGGPVASVDGRTTGIWPITRGQLFTLGQQAASEPEAAMTLLWHALAWGAGSKRRNMVNRMDTVSDDPQRSATLLTAAARRLADDPVDAYELLAPGRRTAIRDLGPAFFTKFLYFAAGRDPHHLCLILDARVAESLIAAGWTSMHARGGWPSATYGRYLELISRWHAELAPDDAGRRPRPDLIERWLFDNG